MSFEPLRKIISRSSGGFAFSKELQIAQVFDAFTVVMQNLWGDDKASFLSPVSFREGKLRIQSIAPSAQQQFNVEGVRIKNEINRKLGNQTVKSIIVVSKGF
ncbi:MAG: DciA family protein [Patescibacteria group bacterium]